MPTINNITSNYVGKAAQGYLTRALNSGDSLDQNLFNVKTGLKEGGLILRRLNVEGLLKDATCAFTPTGQVDLDFKTLTGKKLEVNLEICFDAFEGAWEADDMGESAWDNSSAEYQRALLKYIASKIGEVNDGLLWTGTAIAGSYEGILTKLATDPDVPAGQKIAGVGITAANVAAEIAKVVDAIPDNVFSLNSDLVIAVSNDIGRKYMQALAGFGASGQGGAGYQSMGYVGRKPLDFMGIPMFMVSGLPAGTMLAYRVENMVFGTGVLADWTRVKVLDMRDVTGDDTFRVIMKMYAGVQYGFADEIVTYNV